MLPWVALACFLLAWWADASLTSLGLLGAAGLVGLGLSLRLANQLQSGTGGHAEWVRDVTSRQAAIRSPGWVAGWLLLAAGVLLWLAGH